jgi:putative ABC transport system ATP-binding protein
MNETVLRATGVSRVFGSGDRAVTAVDDVGLELRSGELVVLKGRSGSGKTTLLGMLGGLDRPTRGQVWLDGLEVSAAAEADLVAVRRRRLGFVFQTFGLLPVLSAAENIEIPLRLAGVAPAERDARVRELLELVGLTKHAAQRPSELSGGQQQRVGIARALAMRPGVLLADEPTGQLDSGTAATIMDLLVSLVHGEGVAAIVATHDPLLVERADRVLELHDGRVREQPRHGRHAAT